jgi:hypothetical protein
MATDNTDKTKTVVIYPTIDPSEYALILRVRQIRNQAGDEHFRVELDISKRVIEIILQTKLSREAFTF